MGNPVWALAGVGRLCWQGTPVLEWSGKGLMPHVRPGSTASLVTAVSGSARLDWGRRCVPLTRGLRILWGILCGSLRVSGDSAGKAPRCLSGPEGTCAPGQAGSSASLVTLFILLWSYLASHSLTLGEAGYFEVPPLF